LAEKSFAQKIFLAKNNHFSGKNILYGLSNFDGNILEYQTKKASADLAKKLQQAKTRQAVKTEEMKVKIVHRTRQIELQDQEILRRENELESKVKKPAEAEKYKMEIIAEAEMQRVILEAEAEAESKKVRGEAEAFAIEQKAKVSIQNFPFKSWLSTQDFL